MRLARFTCRGFRALADTVLEPSSAINIIQGGNAQGKTSILEAILYTATARSHRTNTDAELVKHDADGFFLQATAERSDRTCQVEAAYWQGIKRFKVNGVAQTRISDILGKINVVLFSPEDIGLIKGGGSARRRFMDMALSQVSAVYLNALQQYRQALRQRNELLRDHTPDPALLDAWDAQLAQYGTLLMTERQAFVGRLADHAASAYGRIAGGEPFVLAYEPDVKHGESLAAALAKARTGDIKRRATWHGPHRDDIAMDVAGKAARNYASQGQQRTASLALRLAELALVHERTGEYPILMLDEVLAELDEARTRRLFESIGPDVQCLLTTAQPELAARQLEAARSCTTFQVEHGVVQEVR